MNKAKQNRRNKTPEETLTTPPAMIVGEKATTQETVNDIPRQISKRMQKYSIIWSKENLGTITLMEEETRYWRMSRIHNAVSWWPYLPKNGMITHLLDSFYVRPNHRQYWIWIPTHTNPRKCSQTTIKITTWWVWEIPSCLLKHNTVLMKTGVSYTNSQHETLSSTENICQTSEILLMVNIYVYTTI